MNTPYRVNDSFGLLTIQRQRRNSKDITVLLLHNKSNCVSELEEIPEPSLSVFDPWKNFILVKEYVLIYLFFTLIKFTVHWVINRSNTGS